MATDFQAIKIAGFEQFTQQLRELPMRVAKNTLRGAVNAGATVIRQEAQRRAPVRSGILQKAIYQKQIAELSNAVQQMFFVGWRRGQKAQQVKRGGKVLNLDAYYGYFVEFGTSKIGAEPFMRPAFEIKKDEAVEAIRAYLAERIPRELAKR